MYVQRLVSGYTGWKETEPTRRPNENLQHSESKKNLPALGCVTALNLAKLGAVYTQWTSDT